MFKKKQMNKSLSQWHITRGFILCRVILGLLCYGDFLGSFKEMEMLCVGRLYMQSQTSVQKSMLNLHGGRYTGLKDKWEAACLNVCERIAACNSGSAQRGVDAESNYYASRVIIKQ